LFIDGRMEKVVGDRPSCVDAGKKKFMGQKNLHVITYLMLLGSMLIQSQN
tara:strand:+ start:2907 stop:3056 length:150 start_codon:yes stop_codon:yes gene_type:complete